MGWGEKKAMKEAFEQCRVDRTEVCRLWEEKAAEDAELKAIKATHDQLQGELKGQTYILSSTEKKLGETYKWIDFLKKKGS